MRLRLFLFLVVLVITMILGVFAVLLLTGIFTAGVKESGKLLEKELSHTLDDVYEQYGQLSVQAVELSKDLSESMEIKLNEQGFKVTDLQNHPEILEKLIEDEYQLALFSLLKSKSSGVFLILNATSNTKLENSRNSRAGLFIKNMEPNILSSSSPTIIILRGFPNIARKNSRPLHAQWNMEFDISEASYYHLPIEQAAKKTFPLSRLYYWSPATILPGTSEEVMLCSVPLIDSRGDVFGVCGFEISAMLFKLSHMPDNSTFSRTFCMLAPISEDVFDSSGAMFAGGYSARNSTLNGRFISIEKNNNSLFTYRQKDGSSFVGLHMPVRLYPEDSAFSDQKWALALMIPSGDIKQSLTHFNLKLALIVTLLMILGAIISFFLSKQFYKPIANSIDMIKSKGLSAKTNIPEIDDLIEFISLQSEKLYEKAEDELPSAVLQEFLKNTKTLSPAERSVFDLYVQGHNAKEIAEILCLSINTIKTHNKRIYMKLNVASRKELLLYVNMLKETGNKF
jgi:DNA-binding CsgD family transcriptional regulator